MSMLPFIFWFISIVAAAGIYIAIATIIEKSGKARLGATGNLFTVTPKKTGKESPEK